MLSERRLDGVILCLEFIGADELETWRSKLTAIRQYMPVVLTGTMPPGLDFPSVTVDLSACVHTIVEYLTGLGHERIALLGGFDEQNMPLSRDASYHAALEAAHLPQVTQYRVFGRCTVEDGRRQLDEMLTSLVPSQWPTAVIAANDMVALGVLRAAENRGLRVPGDLSVVGCDDVIYAEYSSPAADHHAHPSDRDGLPRRADAIGRVRPRAGKVLLRAGRAQELRGGGGRARTINEGRIAKQEGTTVERFAWKGRIKAGMEAEYKRRHDALWPEMKALLKAAGIRNYSIWSDGETVFGYYECERGVAYAEQVQAGSPVVDRWNDYMKDVLELDMDPATGTQPKLRQMFLLE